MGSELVVVIDEVLAKQAFDGQDPIGKRLWMPDMDYGPFVVVGVVGHVRHWGLAGDDQAQVRAQFYYPFAQLPDEYLRRWSELMSIAVRTEVAPLSEVESLRRELRGAAGDQVLYGVHTMEQLADDSLGPTAVSFIAVWDFRRFGFGAGVHRDLWSAGLFDGTTCA